MKKEKFQALKELLEQKYRLYAIPSFVENDPILIPKRYSKKEDIEIAAFLSATIAWGQRKSIISSASGMMNAMSNEPFNFIMKASEQELYNASQQFKHRTFNSDDGLFFLHSLRNIYMNYGGLESVFTTAYSRQESVENALIGFRKVFFKTEHLRRSQKHVSNVATGSSAKRLNMYLRWMVRSDKEGVDFGLWNSINIKSLYLPLDVHTGRVARSLGLLQRKQNDWKAVQELTHTLRQFDPADPVKYDFALFGMGVYEQNGSSSRPDCYRD
jgi:uncharacterized protein (TIGR02757 family)